jgi:hypothetical protein
VTGQGFYILQAKPARGGCSTMARPRSFSRAKKLLLKPQSRLPSLALRQGHEVWVTAPASDTATGAANAG